MKPRIFVGSATESLDVAHSLQELLDYEAETVVWSQAVLEPLGYTLEQLSEKLQGYDFAIFVFTSDDVLLSRETESRVTRDNVVLELGLAVGILGRERTFIVSPREAGPRLPSDLVGVTLLTYDSARIDQNLVAALGPAASKIRRVIERSGKRSSDRSIMAMDNELLAQLGPGAAAVSEWLNAHFADLRKKIIRQAEERAGDLAPTPVDIAAAAREFAPGHRIPKREASFWERILGSISGVTLIAAVLAIVFGFLGVWTQQESYFDIVKIFAGAVVGSTGAGVVREMERT